MTTRTSRSLSLVLTTGLLFSACTFTLDRELGPGEIRGTLGAALVDGTFEPVAGAQVRVEGSNIATRTDTQGRFVLRHLTEGDYRLRIRHETLVDEELIVSAMTLDVSLPAADAIDLGLLSIKALGSLEGVVQVDGSPAQAEVVVDREAIAVSYADGGYQMRNVEPGRKTIYIRAEGPDGMRLFSGPTVDVKPRETTTADIAVDTLTAQPPARLSLRARLSDEKPPSGVEFELHDGHSMRVLPPTNGSGRIRHAEVPAGVYTVVAKKKGYLPSRLTLLVVTGEVEAPVLILMPQHCRPGSAASECSGIAEGDADGDGIPDYLDHCPHDPRNECAPGVPPIPDAPAYCGSGLQDRDGDGECRPDCSTLSCDVPFVCDDSTGTAACGCPEGHSGDLCEVCADGYQDNDGDGQCSASCAKANLDCSGHGVCDDSGGRAVCECAPGHAGVACDRCAVGYERDGARCIAIPNFPPPTITSFEVSPPLLSRGARATLKIAFSAGTGKVSGIGSVSNNALILTPPVFEDTEFVLTVAGPVETVTASVWVRLKPPSASTSWVWADQERQRADGSSVVTLFISVQDDERRGVSNVPITLTATGDGVVMSQPESANNIELFTATLSSSQPGVKTVTVTAGDVVLDQKATVEFFSANRVGGEVDGLTGTGFVLRLNGENDLAIGADGRFVFPAGIYPPDEFEVTVHAQPENQACVVFDGKGTVSGTDIDVTVKCGSAWRTVVGGDGHTVALKADGTLWTWGDNYRGQLGNGGGTNNPTPAQIQPGQIFTSVAAGEGHTVAVRADGTLWTWGDNASGQLGDGTTERRDVPIQVGSDADFAVVAAGMLHTLALKTDGSLWAWGGNGFGQLGNGGTTNELAPVRIGSDADFTQVAAGAHYSLAVKADGTLWGWGDNSSYQLGDGTTTGTNAPKALGSGFSHVAGCQKHTLAVKTDGTLWTWGSNTDRQLGIEVEGGIAQTPIQVGDESDFLTVACGGRHSLALKTDGSLWAWGYDGDGQVGARTLYYNGLPLRLGGGFASVSAGAAHSLAVKADGSLWTWGLNRSGQIGDGTMTQRNEPLQVGADHASVAAGFGLTMALKTDGSLWSWGYNSNGQLGTGSSEFASHAPAFVGGGFSTVVAGSNHILAVKTDGSLWGWGDNSSGQLGDGTTESRNTPVRIGQDNDFVSAWASVKNSAALKTDGTFWTWGDNDAGQLGDGTTTPRHTPQQAATQVASAAIADNHMVVLKTDGSLWAWGANGAGQLGDGTTTARHAPVQISSDTDFISVTAAGGHTLALKEDGTLWAWGANGDGQLGITGNFAMAPTFVGEGFTWVTTGQSHTLALRAGATLWAWGYGAYGQLGVPSSRGARSPLLVGENYASARAGVTHTVAVKTDGTLWAWGDNTYGQLGDGSTNRMSPGFVP